MAACPIIFYSVCNKSALSEFIIKGLVLTEATFSAIMVSFGILILQISSIIGNPSDGINHIIISFKKRTSGDGEEVEVIQRIIRSGCTRSTTNILEQSSVRFYFVF